MNTQINQALVLETLKERLKYHLACGNTDLAEFMKKKIKRLEGEVEVCGYPGCEIRKVN